jgi:2-polyprenyl-3-methyl-5-hydroxy-6-metoxy-1,4-benzoquinol methylase
MNRSDFLSYKRQFVRATREVLTREQSYVLSEAAFPAYANSNPLISYLFWQRVWLTMSHFHDGSHRERALDFGCGGGVLLPFLAQRCQTVVGLDIDLSPHQKLRTLVRFPENIEVLDVRQRPLESFAKGSFDVITALDVLEHVEDLDHTLAGLRTLLKPGGEILVSGPTENWLYKIGRRIAGSAYSGDYHVRNISDIHSALTQHFRVVPLATLYPFLPLFKLYRGLLQ